MRAIQKPSASAGFLVADLPIPQPGPDEVLIKVTMASFCGTDLHITEWDEWSASRIQPPLVYGHEFCGRVEAVGDRVQHLAKGDYVSAEMHIPCETCHACRTGKRHICENVRIAGIDQDGCYADYVLLPKNQVIQLPENIPPEFAACLDSLGNAVNTVSKANVSGKSVLITGCGPVGLFAVAVAKALGATTIAASDISAYRLDLAQKAGADTLINVKHDNLVAVMDAQTQGRGVDVVLEMSGNERALNDAFTALAPGGTVALLGLPKSTVNLDITNGIIFKEANVIGIHGREIFQTWVLMLDLLASGKLDIRNIITHTFRLDQFGEVIELVKSGECGKILLQANTP